MSVRGVSAKLRGVFHGMVCLASVCAFAGASVCGGAAQAQKKAPAPQILTELDGQDLSALSVSWRRWLIGAPGDSDILADDSGDLCDLGQKGDIWFLAGRYGSGETVRRCVVPAGKYLFIPIAEVMMWDSADGRDCSLLQGDVKAAMDTARDLFLEVDGRRIENLTHYRAGARQCFSLSNETDIYASDGYWAVLKALPAGRHVIRFGNKMGDDGETEENSAQNIEYLLDVQ